MNKEFAPYEQALALKELGFDEPCLAYYEDNELTYGRLNDVGKRRYLQTPLYQQAFRWFREKYNLHRHICYFEDTKMWHGDVYKLKTGGLMNYPMELTNYNSYEEAELGCIDKLIQIVKEK